MFYSSLQAAISHSIYSNINLKVKQVICLEAIYHGRDVVALLPTGYGKSVIFHLLPSLFLDKINYERGAAAHPVVILVSPLNALIKDQIRRLQEGNVKAAILNVKKKTNSEHLELDLSDANLSPHSCSLSIDKILTKPPLPSLEKMLSPRFWETRDQTLPGSLLARPRR